MTFYFSIFEETNFKMAKKDYIQRFILIIELLRKKSASFEEIQEFLLEHDIDISQRTFQRDKGEIEMLYGIEIKFNKKEGFYQINEELSDGKFDRIAESFNVVNALNQTQSVSKFVFLDQRQPQGTEYFHGILHAIQNNLIVTFQLNSYWNQPSFRRCVPKAIKEAQNRWYLIGYDLDKEEIRNFGLDRISKFEITSSKKETPNIIIEDYYQNAFGIETYIKAEKVVIECSAFQAKYFKSLPLHSSQKLIREENDSCQFEFFLHPTNDFIMEIFKYNNTIKVLEPKWLQEEIINRMKDMLLFYNEK